MCAKYMLFINFFCQEFQRVSKSLQNKKECAFFAKKSPKLSKIGQKYVVKQLIVFGIKQICAWPNRLQTFPVSFYVQRCAKICILYFNKDYNEYHEEKKIMFY